MDKAGECQKDGSGHYCSYESIELVKLIPKHDTHPYAPRNNQCPLQVDYPVPPLAKVLLNDIVSRHGLQYDGYDYVH